MIGKLGLVVVGLVGVSVASALAGEIMVTKDGTEIRGELVGFDADAHAYLMRIGRFTKRVDEGTVVEIRDDGAPAAAARPDLPAPPVVPSLPAAPAAAPGGGIGDLMQQLQGAGGGGLQALLSLQGAGGGAPLDPASLPPEALAKAQQLQNNPMMGQLMQKFRDPAYQAQLLESLRTMRRAMNPGAAPTEDDPQLQQIEGLFRQLRQAGGAQEAPVSPDGSGSPGSGGSSAPRR